MNIEQLLADNDKFRSSEGGELKPDSECYQLYKEFLGTGQYPYLRSVTDFICERAGINDGEIQKAVYHQTYLCSQAYREEQAKEYEERMTNEGWQVLTNEKFIELYNAGKRIVATFTKTMDWFSKKYDEKFKLFYNSRTGDCALMRPRQKTRGILINSYFYAKSDGKIFYKEA